MQPDPEIYELTVELEHRTEAGERRDAEDFEEDPVEDEERPERFTLNRRQIQMIALSSSIGTGVFYSSGLLLQTAGPGSLFLGFIFSGTVMYSVMITIGEMISLLPEPGVVFALPNNFLFPGIGFATAVCYTLGYALAIPEKATAFALYMGYWFHDISPLVWISIFVFLPFTFNYFNVRRYSDVEYAITSIKVLAIIAIIIVGFIIIGGGTNAIPLLATINGTQPVFCDANQTECLSPPGFIYWKQGAFKAEAVSGTAGKVLGFWDCCSLAMFCYSDSDVVAMAAHESEFQQRDLPKAVRRISTRLIRYYAAIILILGLTVSSSDPMLLLPTEGFQIYPGGFVVMAIRAGLPVVASLINAAQITATISYATGDLYIVSRCLSAMSNMDYFGNRYRTFAKIFRSTKDPLSMTLGRRGDFNVPWISLVLAAVFVVFAYLNLPSNSEASQGSYSFILNLVGNNVNIAWMILCATYIRFRRACKTYKITGVKEAEHPLQPFLAYWGLFWSGFTVVFDGAKTFLGIHSKYWVLPNNSWWVQFASYFWILFCFVLLLFSRVVLGDAAFKWGDLHEVMVTSRKSPPSEPRVEMEEEELNKKFWKRNLVAALNYLS